MEMYSVPQQLESYLNKEFSCSCGRTHHADIRSVRISAGALSCLPQLVKDSGYKHPYLVCDSITYKIAGSECEQLLAQSGIGYTTQILTHLGFDEATLGELVVNIPVDADVVIAVGTGSISDMVRYMTYKLKLPCFTVATAAPMDGFAASIGIMNVNNLKKTMQAHNTEAIIGDTDILRNAPYRMTVAGFGDLIGKITCLNDWELSAVINSEHICPNIVALVRSCVKDILGQSQLIKEKDPETLGAVMNGLVLSGTAISLYGDSRPASGAEHHMSHYWETIMDQRHERSSMHGEQVAVGTVLVLMLAEELKKVNPDFDAARTHARSYDAETWKNNIREAYGPAADEIIALEEKAQKNSPANVIARIDSMEEHWDEILALLMSLPSSAYLKDILDNVSCPSTPAQINIDDRLLKDTFMYCKEVRARYTIFQTLYDLNLLDELSDKVIKRLSSNN